jgi:hypothetical protein
VIADDALLFLDSDDPLAEELRAEALAVVGGGRGREGEVALVVGAEQRIRTAALAPGMRIVAARWAAIADLVLERPPLLALEVETPNGRVVVALDPEHPAGLPDREGPDVGANRRSWSGGRARASRRRASPRSRGRRCGICRSESRR